LVINNGDLRRGSVFKNKTLAATSWKNLLEFMRRKASEASRLQIVADIDQLCGLCDSVDKENEFVPFSEEDLSEKETPRKILGLLTLLHKLFERGEEERIFSCIEKRLDDLTFSGRDVDFGDNLTGWLGLWYEKWITIGKTPLWVQFGKRGCDHAVINALRRRDETHPGTLCETPEDLLLPLSILSGCSGSEVLDHLLSQLREIKAAVATA
jgi:hypothetical protein